MKRFAFALVGILALALPALAQETLADQVRQLALNNNAINARMARVETKLDALSAKVDTPLSVKAAAVSCNCADGGMCTCGLDCKCDPFAVSQAAPKAVQYRMVCGPNGCSMVPVSSTSAAYADSSGETSASSTGRNGPIRRLFQRIFHRGGRGGCASCGG